MAVLGPRRRALVIPAATIDRVASKLETHGRIARGYLGLGLQSVRLDGDSRTGAMVLNVESGGPGAAAGVRQGDLIVTWQGETLASMSGLVRALGPESVGQLLTLGLRRGGEPIEVRLIVGERPPA
jgi:S1-C subfamily serine protease